MRRINRVIALVTLLVGVGLVAAGPTIFQTLTGAPLPAADASNPEAVVAWSGVAFARAFGALLLVLGAVLWAANLDANREAAVQKALCFSTMFATLLVLVQQVAIWMTGLGLILVVLLGSIAILSGAGLLRRPAPQG